MFDNVIERLESRFMLAAPIFSSFQPHNPPIFLHDGVLTIRGGPGNDRISFSAKLPPSYSSENPDYLIKVRFNDQTHWFHRSKIQLVDIDAGAGDDLMPTLLDQQTQIAPAIGVVLDQKNSHGFGKFSLATDCRSCPPLHAELGDFVTYVLLWSTKTAKVAVNCPLFTPSSRFGGRGRLLAPICSFVR
jgi:hypothetical protein